MGLPSFESYTNDGTESGLFFRYGASPNSADLDPFFKFNTNDFTVVAKDTRQNTEDLNIGKDEYKNSVRTVGIRGPLLYSGWGYDICGLPVPKETDITFDVYTPTDRELWKSGPVDLRWDDERKVWVGGTELLEGKMIQDLPAPASLSTYSQASGEVYRGDGWNVKEGERIRLINRNPDLSLSIGDYFLAAKINYEWRPIGGGGGGGGDESGNILMILGTYEQYSGCPGAPPRPPTGDGGTPCWPTYAWASYKICGYKYEKTGDARGYGKWAWELNGGTAPAFRRFYPAYYGSGECKGVRFLGFSSQSTLVCTCPPEINSVNCFKISFTTPPAPEEGYLTECSSTVNEYNNNNLWDQTITFTLCKGFEDCNYFGTDSSTFISATLQFLNQPIGTGVTNTCYWGPSEFDPCDPCADFGHWALTIEMPGGNEPNCGVGAHVTGKFTLAQLRSIVNSCTTESPTSTVFCDGCGNLQDPPVNFHFINDDVTLTCCSEAESNACP